LLELGIRMIAALLAADAGTFGAKLRDLPKAFTAWSCGCAALPAWSRRMSFCTTNAFSEFNSNSVAPQKGPAFLRSRRKDLDWIFGAKQNER